MGWWENKRVVVTGGAGFLGRHVLAVLAGERALARVPRRNDVDLRDPLSTVGWFRDYAQGALVIHLAANVGGIGYNQANGPALFRDNILIGVNTMHAAHLAGAERFVLIGTACSYPAFAQLPSSPLSLWSGRPEETNAPYGIAKRALIELASSYKANDMMDVVSVIPTNLYGPGDNFDPSSSHVIPALIRRMIEARDRGDQLVEIWGSGNASRDFLHVEDAARGIVLAAERHDSAIYPLNLGSGVELNISYVAEVIAAAVGFDGKLRFDRTKPDGQARRCLDISKAKSLGWRPSLTLEHGIQRTVAWYEKTRRGESDGH